MRKRSGLIWPTRLVAAVFLTTANNACASSSDAGSGTGSGTPNVATCEEWSALPLAEQQGVVVQLYQEGSSNPSQSGASAAVRNVEYHCSQQPNLQLSAIDMDY